MNQVTFSWAGHADHWESQQQLHTPKCDAHTCLYTAQAVYFPSPGWPEPPLLLQARHRAATAAPLLKSSPGLPPRKKMARDETDELVWWHTGLSCAQHWHCPFWYCCFCNWNQEGSRYVSSPQRAAWFCLAQEQERSDLTACRWVHHLAPDFFLYIAGLQESPFPETTQPPPCSFASAPQTKSSFIHWCPLFSLSYICATASLLQQAPRPPPIFSSNTLFLAGAWTGRPDGKGGWPPPHRVCGRQARS